MNREAMEIREREREGDGDKRGRRERERDSIAHPLFLYH
jgi:hypothetical protein